MLILSINKTIEMIANTPKTPYYAVIFTSIRTTIDSDYYEMTDFILELAKQQKGFLGVESARNEVGITVSYWESLEAIKNWKAHSEHRIAQRRGRNEWYKCYKTRIAKVERDYGFNE